MDVLDIRADQHKLPGYRVGKKWGKFTNSRADAIHFATEEIKARSAGKENEQQIVKLITQLLTPEVRFVA